MSPRSFPRPGGALRAALVAATVMALGAALAPTANADRGSQFDSPQNAHGPVKPGKPKPHRPHQADPQPADPQSDAAAEPQTFKATAPPVTAYEMPFSCDEVWTGSTRSGHSPSVRSIDFNRTDDLGDPVVAAAAGVVTTAVRGKKKPSYGQYVVIDHGNDESTLYAHLDSVAVVVGQSVASGVQVGTVGNTGNSFGSHLHFEERKGSSVVDSWFHGTRFPLGSSVASQNCEDQGPPADVPLAGNLLGSKGAELVVFRRTGTPTFHVNRTGKDAKVIAFGAAADQPLLGDWDGNGRVNLGVRSTKTLAFRMKVGRKVTGIKFGTAADLPIAGDWDGVGGWEIGVRRAGTNLFRLRSAGGAVTKVAFGDADDLPVTGDWDGDGTTDLGVYDQASSVFTLRRVDSDGFVWTSDVVFGTPGDLPVAADWDGNGRWDLGVWTPSTGVFSQRLAETPMAARANVARTGFGQAGVVA